MALKTIKMVSESNGQREKARLQVSEFLAVDLEKFKQSFIRSFFLKAIYVISVNFFLPDEGRILEHSSTFADFGTI